MCPSAWATEGPSATRRIVHRRAQRTAIVFAPASVATTSSPARRLARDRLLPVRISTLSDPLVGEPGAPISAGYAAPRRPSVGGTKPTDSTRCPRRLEVPIRRRGERDRRDQRNQSGRLPRRQQSACPRSGRRYGAPRAIPPSTCGAPTAKARARPRQSNASQRRLARCERRDEKAIAEPTDGVDRDPGGKPPTGRSAKPATRPLRSTRMIPGVASGSSAKTTSRPNAQPAPRTRRPLPGRYKVLRATLVAWARGKGRATLSPHQNSRLHRRRQTPSLGANRRGRPEPSQRRATSRVPAPPTQTDDVDGTMPTR